MSTNTRVVQLIEPDEDVLVGTRGDRDESLEENGSASLVTGQTELVVVFHTIKFSSDYEFDVYFENLTDASYTVLQWIPIVKNTVGFTIGIAPMPDTDNYVCYWRVRVRDTAEAVAAIVDAPESARTPLIQGATEQTILLSSPRSTDFYGFSEWRVENTTDSGATQQTEWIQLTGRTKVDFTIAINPPTDTPNYFFIWRTP
jgi:hypothetical protein